MEIKNIHLVYFSATFTTLPSSVDMNDMMTMVNRTAHLLGAVLLALNFVFSSGAAFWCVYIVQITNISGAAGDMYVTGKFLRLPRDILVHDSGVSMTVYAK